MSVLGSVINGYKIIEFIDSGGFGSVYKAVKESKLYAIKIFREDYVLKEFRDRGENNRIAREIEIMKSIDHPFLIKYIDDFKESLLNVASYFLVMEFAEGTTLARLMESEQMNERNAKEIFLKIAEGIQALHTIRGEDEEKGIIHRDLKPQNIIVNSEGNIKILDYGLSKVIDYTSITSTGRIMGSPAYMSPEQIKSSKYIDKRSDLYTMGVIFYQMLTGQFPYEYASLPDLYNKILTAEPIPPRRWKPTLKNKLENVILKLLEKEPYNRYTTVTQLIEALTTEDPKTLTSQRDLEPKMFLRLYDDKAVLSDFVENNEEIKLFVDFPANLQNQQKGLLRLIQHKQFVKLIDPATVRLPYAAQGNVKGLQALPYAPGKLSVITPDYLRPRERQLEYVQKVIDEQVKLGANILISPYHYLHNTNVPATGQKNPVAEWFDLDIKLLKESIDYKNTHSSISEMPLYAGICLNADSLLYTDHTTYLLNVFSAIECDGYFVYVDTISNETPAATLFHYIKMLVSLQSITGKPVIAGRVGPIGLGLLCAGISGFSTGTARFNSFSEELYKEETDTYNLYERYYFPDLLQIVAIERKTPVRLGAIMEIIGHCNCYYCSGKDYVELAKSKASKLHFLEVVHDEIERIKTMAVVDRIPYFIARINTALQNYRKLGGIFKPEAYQFLSNWRDVFTEFNK
jgi:eukaryotic-like serine/threonine-protein kinase